MRGELLSGLGLALSLAAGCSRGDGETGVELRIDGAPGAPVPDHLELDWLDGDDFLFHARRVPGSGAPGTTAPLATVRIAITSVSGDRVRRATVRGYAGDRMVSQGAARIDYVPGAWTVLPMVLAERPLPDRDNDGVPDLIDGCPDDSQSNAECAPRPPDAGVLADAASDAVQEIAGRADAPGVETSVDAAADAAGSDGAADAAPDAPAAPPDAPPFDVRPADARFDVPVVPPQPFACGRAMLVSDDVALAADRPLLQRLQALGCATTSVSDNDFDPTQAVGLAVVVVSDSIAGSAIKAELRALTTPVVLMRADLFDDTGMTGPTEETDWSHDSDEGLMVMVGAGHPLAAGLTGTIAFNTKVRAVGWGRPEATAAIIGVTVRNAARALLFGYELGAVMTGGVVAPARRVAFPIHIEGFAELNGNGWALFDAGVKWATGH